MNTFTKNRPALMPMTALGPTPKRSSLVAATRSAGPLGITLHVTPLQHIALPARIRTEFQAPVYFDADPKRADDAQYVQQMYTEIEKRIQAGMDKLARQRKSPIFG